MNQIEVLEKTKGILEDGFTHYYFARDNEGHSVDPSGETAVAWCIRGALRRALGITDAAAEREVGIKAMQVWAEEPYIDLLYRMLPTYYRSAMSGEFSRADCVATYNNENTQAAVIALVEDAIGILAKEGEPLAAFA